MATIEERLETARLRLQQDDARVAVTLLESILRDDPNHVESLALLANLALGNNKPDMARDLLLRATKLRPDNGTLRMRLGVAYHNLGQFDDALTELEQARRLQPRDGLIHFHLGNTQLAKGLRNDATDSYQRAIDLRPQFTAAHYRLANVLSDAGAMNAAVLAYQKVLELEPRRDDAYVDLGNVLRRCNNDKQAMNCFRTALKLNPRSVSAHNNLSNALRVHGKAEEAAAHMRCAVEIAPRNHILRNGLGLALEKLGQFDDAMACFRKSLELNPWYANGHYNLARLHQELGEFDLAEAGYQRALECDPDTPEAHYRLSMMWLLKGDFARAWPKYHYRWKMEEARGSERTFDKPAWDGGSLEGKTLLIHAEQGLGDTLQFVRYAKLVRPLAAKVILEVPRRLVLMMTSCQGIDEVVAYGDPLPEFDVQIPMLSMPELLGTTLGNIPAEVPYLFAQPVKIDEWRSRLAEYGGLRVGIAWQGKKTYLRDNARSIPLTSFAGVAAIPGVTLFSLQKGFGSDQLAQLGAESNIVDLAPQLDAGAAFEDTAAVMKNLDLVITSDTSIAHLAGGLGAPVWVALGYVPEWRWLLDRSDSPWYPTMRLFRQQAVFDWPSAFTNIEQALREMVELSQTQAASAGA